MDEANPSWWGVTLLVGPADIDRTAVAAQVGYETAQQGDRVLWLGLEDSTETAVFKLLTRLSRVKARSVFVDRSLQDPDWVRLSRAKEALAEVPLLFGSAQGASLADLRACISDAQQAGPVELVVLDGVRGIDTWLLAQLEELAAELDVALLVVATLEPGTVSSLSDMVAPGALPLRPGSLVLYLGWKEKPRPAAQREETQLLYLGFSRIANPKRAEVALVRFVDICGFYEVEGGAQNSVR